MNPDIMPSKSINNIDIECNIKTMFKSEESKNEFIKYFRDTCYYKNECEIDFENMLTNVTKDDNSWEIKTNKLSEMISQTCYERIFDIEITSPQFISIIGCKSDIIAFGLISAGFLHKEEIGFITVVTDILSTLIIYYMFNKLNSMNDEYLEILDNNVIKMKDFSI